VAFVPPPLAKAPEALGWAPLYRSLALGAAFVAAFGEGLALAWSETPLQALCVLTEASAVTLYATLDAKVHGKQYLRSFEWMLMWTWPLGLLAHLVWTRRARGALVYLGWLTLWGVSGAAGWGLGRLIALR